uniref:Transketolase like 2 n=1 Tax=Sus scrofa TaxID=9823 RepID=A0A8W4FCX1_PIG
PVEAEPGRASAMASDAVLDTATAQVLQDVANRLHIHCIRCCSAAEIMSVLYFHTMKYRQMEPRHPDNDRFILSKEGHPTPRLSFVDVATGSLGQGLGAACGMAFTGKYLDRDQKLQLFTPPKKISRLDRPRLSEAVLMTKSQLLELALPCMKP